MILEMMFHWEKKEGLYHGHAVGVAMIMSAQWYQRLRTLSHNDVDELLKKAIIPPRSEQIAEMKKNLPQIAEELIESDPIYLQLCDAEKFRYTCEQILKHWEEILAVAAAVPDPEAIRDWIKRLGGPVTPQELGVSEDEVKIAVDYSYYLRERFSINILRKLFDW